MDAPDHDRVRNAVKAAFEGRHLDPFRPLLQEIVRSAVAELPELFDAVSDLAVPISYRAVFAVLDIPESDQKQCKEWSDPIADYITGRAEGYEGAVSAVRELEALRVYIRRRLESGAASNASLTRRLQDHVDAGRVTLDEAVNLYGNILVDGHEPLAIALANGIWILGTRADVWEDFKSGQVSTRVLVEETLRLESSFQFSARIVREPLVFHGYTFRPGERVLLMLASANRDEARFAAPDHFHAERTYRGHKAFGSGAHHCLGHQLAREVMSSLFEALRSRARWLELDAEAVPWHQVLALRSAVRMPVIALWEAPAPTPTHAGDQA
jgi:cytochrome P450